MARRGLTDEDPSLSDTRAGRARLPFYLLLSWFVLLPWPLGANRDWLWPWYAAGLFTITALAFWRVDVTARWHQAHAGTRVALICLGALAAIDALRAALAQLTTSQWAADPDAAVLGALKSASVWAVLACAVLLVSSRRRARWLLGCLFVAGLLQALLGIALTLGGWQPTWFGHRLGGEFAAGTYINRNHYAGLLELSGAVGFGLLASGLRAREGAVGWREWVRRIGHAVLGSRFAVRAGLAVIVVALVLTRSRMGNAGFFSGLTCAGIAALIWWRPLPRILIWLLLSIVAIDVLVLGAWVGVDKLAQRVAETHLVAADPGDRSEQTTAVSVEPSDEERWVVAVATLELWRAKPLLGHGAGSFRMAFPAVKPASVGLYYEHAHNDYLETLAERGVLGLLLFLVAAAGLGWAALQGLRLRHDSLVRGLCLASIGTAVAFALHSAVDFNLQIPANLFWFQICLSLGAVAHALPRASSTTAAAISAPSGSAGDRRGSQRGEQRR